MTALDALIVSAWVLLAIRAALAIKWLDRMTLEASIKTSAAMHAGDYESRFYEELPGYFALMFDLTTWRYCSPFKAV